MIMTAAGGLHMKLDRRCRSAPRSHAGRTRPDGRTTGRPFTAAFDAPDVFPLL